MHKILIFIKTLFIFSFLTLVTQIGGACYLLYKLLYNYLPIPSEIKSKRISRYLSFLLIYLLFTLLIVPQIAPLNGRTALPLWASIQTPIQPHNMMTCLLNRHYVDLELEKVAMDIALPLNRTYSELYLTYLDANFPFWDGFPLLPHLSHNDGKKLDISFIYQNKDQQEWLDGNPSFWGYGFVEPPQKGESQQGIECAKKGHWQYNLLTHLVWEKPSPNIIWDPIPNKHLLKLMVNHPKINKIFIEPHLKERMGLTKVQKVRFQGCHSVRHDDHIHLQL